MSIRRWLVLAVLVLAAWLCCASWVAGIILVGFSLENVQSVSLRLWWDYAFEYWSTPHRASVIDAGRRGALYTGIALAAFAAFALSPAKQA